MTNKQWYKYPELLCRQTLCEMAEAGLKATEIADLVGCSVKSVHKAAETHGVNLMAERIVGMRSAVKKKGDGMGMKR